MAEHTRCDDYTPTLTMLGVYPRYATAKRAFAGMRVKDSGGPFCVVFAPCFALG
jgi:hypothetical protein